MSCPDAVSMNPKPLSVSFLIEPSAIFLSIHKSVDASLPEHSRRSRISSVNTFKTAQVNDLHVVRVF
jgi:hypothetical protein